MSLHITHDALFRTQNISYSQHKYTSSLNKLYISQINQNTNTVLMASLPSLVIHYLIFVCSLYKLSGQTKTSDTLLNTTLPITVGHHPD